jgi:glycosyltransferase involved in cell wall biosynthesis
MGGVRIRPERRVGVMGRSGRGPTVLVFAYACRPDVGSEPGAGWGMVMAINEVARPIVLTRPDNMDAIGKWLETAEGPVPEFVPVDEPRWAGRMRSNRLLAFAGYLAWLRPAELAAWDIIATRDVDLVHHVTYSPYWLPAPTARLGVPSIWGPVGGAVRTPRSLLSLLGRKGRITEELDRFAVLIAAMFPSTRRTWREVSLRVAQNRETLARIRVVTAKPAVIFNHALVHHFDPPEPVSGEDRYAVWLSPLESRKGPELAVRALAMTTRPIDLRVVGDGPERRRMEALCADLGLTDRVQFVGRVDHAAAIALVAGAEAAVFTGLREEGGLALTEALYCGTPTIVLDNGGPAEIARASVDPSRVAIIDVSSARSAIKGIATALDDFSAHPRTDRGSLLDRSEAIERIAAMYAQVLSAGERSPEPEPNVQDAARIADDKPMPTVSIIMPAYNAQEFLADAIQSILDQTLRSLELIIVDDGSVDSTREIAQSFAARDDRVQVVPIDRNEGIAHAINAGIKEARADLIGRLDSDDLAVPTRFERQVEFLTDHPEVVVVGSNAVHISATGERLGLSIAGPPDVATFERLRRDGEVTMVLDGTALMRRSVLDLVGGYDESFASAAEVDLYCRMADHGAIVAIAEPLSLYRLHTGSNVQSQFYTGRMVHRFVAYRQKELAAGREPIGYREFLAAERRASAWRRSKVWLADYARAHYREAGVSIAHHRWLDAGSHVARSFVADPAFVVGRVWHRRLSPDARHTLNETTSL